jgi:hypothetical protein
MTHPRQWSLFFLSLIALALPAVIALAQPAGDKTKTPDAKTPAKDANG